MSRQYMNERWCVRCNRCTPTPFLKCNRKCLEPVWPDVPVIYGLDIGCGNGRNIKFATDLGYNMLGLDMAGDVGKKFVLGAHRFPCRKRSQHIILANYVFMFLDRNEEKQVVGEILRVAATDCRLAVELYPAKDSYTKTAEQLQQMKRRLIDRLTAHKWDIVKDNKEKFIAVNGVV